MEEIDDDDDDCGANVDYDRGRCSADDAKVTLIDWERPTAFIGTLLYLYLVHRHYIVFVFSTQKLYCKSVYFSINALIWGVITFNVY